MGFKNLWRMETPRFFVDTYKSGSVAGRLYNICICICIYIFPEPRSTCDSKLIKRSPLCFCAKDYFIYLLPRALLYSLARGIGISQ